METMSGEIRWIDIEQPGAKDIAFLRKEFGFHPLILAELPRPSARSRVEAYKNYLFFIYHLPVFNPKRKSSERSEVDFLVTKDTIVTVRYGALEAVDAFRAALAGDADFRRKALSHTGKFTYYFLDSLIHHSIRQLAHVEKKVEAIGAELFDGGERGLLERISYIKRDILEHRIITEPQRALFDSLKTAGEKFWGASMTVYFDTLIGAHLQLSRLLEMNRESLESFERTNAQMVNTNINRVMQKFGVLAFITFPAMLAVSLFDIVRPVFGNPTDGIIAVAVVCASVTCMIIYFRDKGWL